MVRLPCSSAITLPIIEHGRRRLLCVPARILSGLLASATQAIGDRPRFSGLTFHSNRTSAIKPRQPVNSYVGRNKLSATARS